MRMKNLEKCWIYNELSDIPDEYIVFEKETNKTMFNDLKRILKRKGWITENNKQYIENENINFDKKE